MLNIEPQDKANLQRKASSGGFLRNAFSFVRGECQRLLDEDRHAMVERSHRLLSVQRLRRDDEQCVDLGICQ